MKVINSIAKIAIKSLSLNLIYSLLPISLILIATQSAKADYGGELCGLYNRDGTREFLNLTAEASKVASRNPENHVNNCLKLVSSYRFEKTIPLSSCQGIGTVDVYIYYSWQGQLYNSNFVGIIGYQGANTEVMQHCNPVGFAGGCSWSERIKTISDEKCYLLLSS
jgi:hypothetical protein